MKVGNFDAADRYPREDIVVVDAALPTDAKDSSLLLLLEPYQAFDIPTIQSSGRAITQRCVEIAAN